MYLMRNVFCGFRVMNEKIKIEELSKEIGVF